MKTDLTSQQLLLAELMSNISERCYYAGWMQGLEYVLWDAVLHGKRKYGHNAIFQTEIEILSKLSKEANAWIVFDNQTEETPMDLHKWKQKFQQDIQQNSELLKG